MTRPRSFPRPPTALLTALSLLLVVRYHPTTAVVDATPNVNSNRPGYRRRRQRAASLQIESRVRFPIIQRRRRLSRWAESPSSSGSFTMDSADAEESPIMQAAGQTVLWNNHLLSRVFSQSTENLIGTATATATSTVLLSGNRNDFEEDFIILFPSRPTANGDKEFVFFGCDDARTSSSKSGKGSSSLSSCTTTRSSKRGKGKGGRGGKGKSSKRSNRITTHSPTMPDIAPVAQPSAPSVLGITFTESPSIAPTTNTSGTTSPVLSTIPTAQIDPTDNPSAAPATVSLSSSVPTDNNLTEKSSNPTPGTTSESPTFALRLATCGRPNFCDPMFFSPDIDEFELEGIGVRCCSDTPIDGFEQWGDADVCPLAASELLDGACVTRANFFEAEIACGEVGARLCTITELKNACAASSGCGLNVVYVWSSSTENE